MEAISFKADTRMMKQWAEAWKEFPRQSGKWAAKMVNEMAFQFRDEFPKVLA